MQKINHEAIKRIRKHIEIYKYKELHASHIVEALETAISALQAQGESPWIPVTERLPENNEWYIVTILDEHGDTPHRYSDYGWYLKQIDGWIIDSELRTDVIAWMPLPKPYKEDKS